MPPKRTRSQRLRKPAVRIQNRARPLGARMGAARPRPPRTFAAQLAETDVPAVERCRAQMPENVRDQFRRHDRDSQARRLVA